MDKKTYYENVSQMFHADVGLDRSELLRDPRMFVDHVEHALALLIADEVMKQLRPAIAEAIQKSFSK
jgi:hypothetical protein